jgi:putative ABC transport system substrate-binding protein
MNNRRKLVIALGAGALAVPFGAFAQPQSKVWRIGVLAPESAASTSERLEYIRAGLRDLGYLENKNIVFELRFADSKYEDLPRLAADLVRMNVDVLVALGTICAKAAKQATTSIPIVMVSVGDPIATGLVTSLARPGGNATGIANLSPELMLKRIELIHETSPRAKQVAMLVNAGNPSNANNYKIAAIAVKSLKIDLQKYDVTNLDEIKSAFATMAKKGAGAVVFAQDSLLQANYASIALLAETQRLPSSGPAEFATAGGLIGLGALNSEVYRRAATYIDKILKGTKAGDIPVEQPTLFETVVNMKTAKRLGLKIPNSILVRATKVIE